MKVILNSSDIRLLDDALSAYLKVTISSLAAKEKLDAESLHSSLKFLYCKAVQEENK